MTLNPKVLFTLLSATVFCSANAAEVTVYGLLDQGVQYLHKNYDFDQHNGHLSKSTDNLAMTGSLFSGSRLGLRGQEQLSDNLKIGFVLENGLNVDDGSFSMGDGKIFGREAAVYLEGDYGRVAFGRFCSIGGIYGSYAIFHPIADNFWGGWSTYSGTVTRHSQNYSRMDNAVTYVSPQVGPMKFYAQYSFNLNGQEDEELSRNNRYGALGATFKSGNLQLVGVADFIRHDDTPIDGQPSQLNDGFGVKFGGNYAFDSVKLFAMGQWLNHSVDFMGVNSFFLSGVLGQSPTAISKKIDQAGGFNGYTFAIGTDSPLWNGTFKTQLQYADAESDAGFTSDAYGADTKLDLKAYVATMGYLYPLSKRTMVYSLLGYSQAKYKTSGDAARGEMKEKVVTALATLVHTF